MYSFKVTKVSRGGYFINAFGVDAEKAAVNQTIMSNIAVSSNSFPDRLARDGKVFLGTTKDRIGFGATTDFPIANQYSTPTSQEIDAFDDFVSTHDVYVWYAIAAPTTEQITLPQIPTINGQNTLSIGTTLQPSTVSITGHIKPSSSYGNLTDVNGVYIYDKDGVQLKVTG